MNDKKINKLNDRKRKLDHEYNQGKDYFMETSMENFIRRAKLIGSLVLLQIISWNISK